jgi:E3 ubiquitin-protein ligase HECTD2
VLSIEKTRRLIDQCVTSYLLGCLKHVDAQRDGLQTSPPQSPVAGAFESSQLDDSMHELHPGSSEDSKLLSHKEALASLPPVRQHGLSETRPIPQRDVRRMDSGTYSSSSPGNLYGPSFEDTRHPKNLGPQAYQPTGQPATDEKVEKVTGGAKGLFRLLDDYIIISFGSLECINTSFSTVRPNMTHRAKSEGVKSWVPSSLKTQTQKPISPENAADEDGLLSELDAKTLLLGDFAENGSWWTGGRSEEKIPERPHVERHGSKGQGGTTQLVNLKSPHIDWLAVSQWYLAIIDAGNSWRIKLDELNLSRRHSTKDSLFSDSLDLEEIEKQILEAQSHSQRVLLKATESLLKRPGRPMKEPQDVRFLLIILANPLLYPTHIPTSSRDKPSSKSPSKSDRVAPPPDIVSLPKATVRSVSPGSRNMRKGSSGQHSGIIKRIMGLLANVPNECHHHLVSWFSRLSDSHFQKSVDLVGSFVTYRLTRQHGKQREPKQDQGNQLVPSLSSTTRGSSAAFHAALGASSRLASKKSDGKPQPVVYNDDWQIKAAAKVMALFFSANNYGQARKGESRSQSNFPTGSTPGSRGKSLPHGQIIATSDFYNTLLDYSDLIADFEAWEAKRGKFSFCQYPFFLSIWAKIQIMEHDARRQMEVKAREAFFDSIMTRQMVNQYLVLKIRRECLVEDSLKGVSEVVGSGSEEIKKGLRIEFRGEEGIDAGGLRKEWFLLLVRDVFNPEHGMFSSRQPMGRILISS